MNGRVGVLGIMTALFACATPGGLHRVESNPERIVLPLALPHDMEYCVELPLQRTVCTTVGAVRAMAASLRRVDVSDSSHEGPGQAVCADVGNRRPRG